MIYRHQFILTHLILEYVLYMSLYINYIYDSLITWKKKIDRSSSHFYNPDLQIIYNIESLYYVHHIIHLNLDLRLTR